MNENKTSDQNKLCPRCGHPYNSPSVDDRGHDLIACVHACHQPYVGYRCDTEDIT